MGTLIDEMTAIFRKVFNDNSIELNNEMTAGDIDSWDSLSHMMMIAEVEKHFSVKFSLREINKLKNVGTLVNLVESKLVNKN